MKKLAFLFVITVIFSSCQEYEFQDEKKDQHLYTEIKLKSSQGEFTGQDTAYIKADIRVIFMAVTYSGTPTEWHWDFGDGTEASGQQVDYMYSQEGTYNISVKVVEGNYSYTSDLVLIVGDTKGSVFMLHSTEGPNNQGKMKYVISGDKGYIPNPPVPETGPFGYQGSDSHSDWDVIQLNTTTNDDRVYWEILTHNAVYSQAYGGYDGQNNFIWAVMDNSRFFSTEYDHPRIGFLNGELVEEENFYVVLLGDSGDDGENPEIRFEVDEDQDKVNVFVNVVNYAENINYPKVRFKVNKGDNWSTQQNCEWVGGTGYVKYTTSLNQTGEYRLRIEPDHNDQGVYTNMSNSDFYKADEKCFVWQIVGVDGEKSAQIP